MWVWARMIRQWPGWRKLIPSALTRRSSCDRPSTLCAPIRVSKALCTALGCRCKSGGQKSFQVRHSACKSTHPGLPERCDSNHYPLPLQVRTVVNVVPRIASNIEQSFGAGADQQVVDDLLVLQGKVCQFPRQNEKDMHVGVHLDNLRAPRAIA